MYTIILLLYYNPLIFGHPPNTNWIELSRIQALQNIGISPCKTREENYCEKHVANSICYPQRDECFCRLGYVAIREADEIVCRTLLTDLSCRIDADCTHVDASICHPGAGKCVCPGGTIYVVHLHACRTRVFHGQTEDCNTCVALGGKCFAYREGDEQNKILTNIFASSTSGIGCECPSPGRAVSNLNSFMGAAHRRLCQVKLVDIGESCDRSERLCRSKTAVCTWPHLIIGNASILRDRICQCPSDYVPVYQIYLRYHECFPKIRIVDHHHRESQNPNTRTNKAHCSTCQAIGGACYDENADGMADGCQCPADRSHHIEFGENRQLSKPCQMQHVYTKCTDHLLSVCYNPRKTGLFQSLPDQLERGICELTVGALSMQNESCRLRQMPTLPVGIEFNASQTNWDRDLIYCVHFDKKTTNSMPCGIRMTVENACNTQNHHRTISYQGIITVNGNRPICGLAGRVNVPFACNVTIPCEKKSEVKMRLPILQGSVPQLHVINAQNKSTQYANEQDSMRMEIRLPVELGTFIVDYCIIATMDKIFMATDHKEMQAQFSKAVHVQRCGSAVETDTSSIPKVTLLRETLWPPVLSPKPVHYSEPFQLFPINQIGQIVRLVCQLHHCPSTPFQCVFQSFQAKMCNSTQTIWNISDSILLTADLTVSHSTGHKPVTSPSISCLSLKQLLLACCALILLDLIICGLFLWTYRHQNRALRDRSVDRPRSGTPLVGASTIAWTNPTDKQSVCEYDMHQTMSTVPKVLSPRSVSSLSEVDRWVHAQLVEQIHSNPSTVGCSRSHRTHSVLHDIPSIHAPEPFQFFLESTEGKCQLLEHRSSCLEPDIV